MSFLTLGSYLAQTQTLRAAVIPYILLDNELYFLLGQDSQSGDLTDFGGGVKKYESTLAAALREFDEESDEIFGPLCKNSNNFSKAIALLDSSMGVLFIPLPREWYKKAPISFQDKKGDLSKKKTHREIDKLIWVAEGEFENILKQDSDRMWKKIQKFYRKGYNSIIREALILIYRNGREESN